jgi:hypothetical protein
MLRCCDATFRTREIILSEFVTGPAFLKQYYPINSALPCNSASRQVVDRQKLTSIWSRFEPNIALPRFLQISVIFPARLLEVISALKADFCRGEQTMEAVGRCGLEIVSRGLTRVASHGADLVRRFASNFPPNFASHSDRLRISPRDGHTRLEPSSIASRETSTGLLLRCHAVTAVQQPSIMRSSI